MNKEEKARQEELLLKVWAKIAKQSLEGKKDWDILPVDSIESHKGRRDKAIRLLSGYTQYAGKATAFYGTPSTQYKILRMEESKALAVRGPYIVKRDEIYDEMFNNLNGVSNEHAFEEAGYLQVGTLTQEVLLHVYWYPEQYQIIKSGDNVLVYPKDQLKERDRMILRAIVEHHFQRNYRHSIERYLGIKEGTFKDTLSFELNIRNHSYMAYNFNQERILGKNGYLEEYEHYIRYFTKLKESIEELKKIVDSKGGYAKVVEEMRKDSINILIKQAPLHMNAKMKDSDAPYSSKDELLEKAVYVQKLSARYILNAECFKYDYLYGDDPSIPCILNAEEWQSSVHEENPYSREKITFLPDDAELELSQSL